jgi:hypothetical protein
MERIILTIVTLGTLAAFAFGGGCDSCRTDEITTLETLNKAGFNNAKTGDYGWFTCGEGDWYATEFTARNSDDEKVEGVVCCGIFTKGCTIRY